MRLPGAADIYDFSQSGKYGVVGCDPPVQSVEARVDRVPHAQEAAATATCRRKVWGVEEGRDLGAGVLLVRRADLEEDLVAVRLLLPVEQPHIARLERVPAALHDVLRGGARGIVVLLLGRA